MPNSNEFFIEKADGTQSDAELHEQILAEGDDASAKEVTRRMLSQWGWPPEQIKHFFGE